MKRFVKKFMLLGAAALSLAAGTVSTTSVLVNAQGKELNVAASAEIVTIDPAKVSDQGSSFVIYNVFEGLTRGSADFKTQEPGVAESWEISEDGKTYTFKLRSDAKWSNGDTVTAGDFEYAWKRLLAPETAADYAPLLYVVEGAEAYNTGSGKVEDVAIKAVDDTTFEVKLAHPTAYFLELTSFVALKPVNQKVVEANATWADDLGEHYVTNGAYRLAEWNHNADYVLEKSDTYWDRDNVKLDKLNAQIVESDVTATNMFRSGEIDYLGMPLAVVSLDALESFKKEGILTVRPQSAIYWYKLNTKDSVMSNVNIRKALALAVDRQALVDNITKAEQLPALGYVPTSVKGFETDRGYFKDADYDKAKEYLAKGLEELGLKDPSELSLKISLNTSEAHAAIAQFIQEGWSKNLGVKAEIENTEFQVYLDRLKTGDYQIGRLGWSADYNDATTFLGQYSTADNGNNYTGWSSPEYKALLDKAESETDEAKRTELLKEAEALLADAVPAIPLYYYTYPSVSKPNVKLEASPLGVLDLKYADVE